MCESGEVRSSDSKRRKYSRVIVVNGSVVKTLVHILKKQLRGKRPRAGPEYNGAKIKEGSDNKDNSVKKMKKNKLKIKKERMQEGERREREKMKNSEGRKMPITCQENESSCSSSECFDEAVGGEPDTTICNNKKGPLYRLREALQIRKGPTTMDEEEEGEIDRSSATVESVRETERRKIRERNGKY